MSLRNVYRTLAIALAALALHPAALAVGAGDKTDVVVLQNGDSLHGDIKRLAHGILTFKTLSLDEVSVVWEDVASLTSKYRFEFEVTSGQTFLGHLADPASPGTAMVVGRAETHEVPLGDVVWIRPVKTVFWDRVDGYINAGLNYTKASDTGQLSFSADARYEEERYRVDTYVSTFFTYQREREDTSRSTLGGGYTHYLENRWEGSGLLAFESNEQLGIDLRTSLLAGLGYNLIQRPTTLFSLTGGLSGNLENATSGGSNALSLEALAVLNYRVFLRRTPKLDLNTTLRAFPSLTDSGRLRASLDTRLRDELIKDFFWDLTLFVTYDSDPPNENAETSDWGLTTSLGYSF